MTAMTQDDTDPAAQSAPARTLRWLNATFIEVAIHLGLVAFLFYSAYALVHPFLPVIVWSIVLTVALYPVFARLAAALGGREALAAILITILGLLIIIGPATWLGVGLVESLPGLIARIEKGGLTIPPPWESVKDWPFFGQPIYDYWKTASNNISDVLKPFLPQLKPIGEFLLGVASKAGAGTLVFLFSVVITGFLFTRGPTLLAATRALARRVDPNYGESFLDLAGATIRAVSRGVIGVSLLQAIIGGVGVSVAGVPFASVLTLAILVLGIVQLGPIIVIVPLIIWGWLELSTAGALAFTLCMAAVYAVEVVMKPFVLAHGLRTPMLVIFIGVIGGILEHGIPGLFAGPIVLAVAWEVSLAWIYEREGAAAIAPTSLAATAPPTLPPTP
jgi:predicted PurR-regulated permease PerM